MGGKTSAQTVEIRLFGDLEVRRNGAALPLPASKKTRALLAYLVVTARPHLRETLCDLLWQGPDDPRAALRWSLTKLRGVLDSPGILRIAADRERIAFEPCGASSDLARVRAVTALGVASASTDDLRAAAASIRGEALDGLDLPDCYRYHEWYAAEREAARALHAAILDALIERLASEPEDALGLARARVALDPLHEPAHVAVVRLLATLGRAREAQHQYDTCKRILSQELGRKPSLALVQARARFASTQASTAPAPPATPPTTPSRLPLVGRARVTALIAETVAVARRGAASGVLLFAGEPGIGKTRLLDEVAACVGAAGGTTLRGRAFEAERIRPYGVWVDALRSVRLESSTDVGRGDSALLLPELGAPAIDAHAADRTRLFDAVVRVLTDLGGKAPVVGVILDDLHWFDEASVALLHYVARAVKGSRIVVACGTRPAELEDNPVALRVVRALGREHELSRVDLEALAEADVVELARTIDPNVDGARVVAESAGNPLFAIEVSNALRRAGEKLGVSLAGLIDDRLASVEGPARDVVGWAAAIGGTFDADVLARASGAPPAEHVAALEELERRGIVRASTSKGQGSYDFVHDLVRDGAYRRLSEPRRRLVHARLAVTLGEASATDDALAPEIARHAALGGDDLLAVRAALRGAERCLRVFANAEAARLATNALAIVGRLEPRDRVGVEMRLMRAFVLSGASRGRAGVWASRFSRAIKEADDAGLKADAADGLHTLSLIYRDAGEFDAAHESTLRAAVVVRSANDDAAARQLADSARCLAILEREMDRAETLLAEARALPSAISLAGFAWADGLIHLWRGDDAGGCHLLGQALESARREDDHWAECEILVALAMHALDARDVDAARAWCALLVPVAAKMGEGSEGPAADALVALVCLMAGDKGAREALATAMDWLRDVDSKGMHAYVLALSAEIALARGDREEAVRLANEAVRLATVVDRRNLRARAKIVLARGALDADERAVAMAHADDLRGDLASPLRLSARTRSALAELSLALGPPIPTMSPTGPPTLGAHSKVHEQRKTPTHRRTEKSR